MGVSVHINLTPKSTAEWVFYPSKKTMAAVKRTDLDVGLVIERGEVLSLIALDTPKESDGRIIIELREGRIELWKWKEKWDAWTQPLDKATKVYSIDEIIMEYSTDN